MKTKNPKEIIRNYRLKFVGLVLLVALALALLIWLMTISTVLGVVLIVILAFNVRKPFEMLKRKDIESVLYEELDPDKFAEVVALGGFGKSKQYAILCAMSRGEHEKVLALADELANKSANPVDKCNRLYRRAYVYFEQQDLKKIGSVLSEFESLKRAYPKFSGIFSNFSVFDKFDAYLDDDFEYVRDVCDVDLSTIKEKNQNHKITRLNVSFYRACALAKLGENEEAKLAFEKIIDYAPKMYKAKLAREWIENLK
ncbi:MAG: tol-pal system YbgF family protein [Eubacteriales bacterium]